ncbi:Ger(x)C family spore germination protein [Metabacillus fastidiosus]|uniref:Ger(x)C family spore germination protein n=1 Tax=Metabacillus fastidiosus TaxID=1458 RepID=UPI002E2345B0|nr:Ger(x)C family spore germination protein [Metabacillus fastidiosus]MED4531207.1 Ger(x)C family spore germination protein [Metabacillus fastidiosus]
MGRYVLFIFVMIITLMLSGCYDSRSPERVAYVHGMAIDYKDGEYTLYLQLINFGSIAKSEASGGGGQGESSQIIKIGSGKNISDAIVKILLTAQEELYFGNLSFIILGDQLLKEKGIEPVIDLWSRYPETRYKIYFYTGDNLLKQAITIKPILEVSKSLNRLADPENIFHQSSTIPIMTLRDIIIGINEPGHTIVIPNIFIQKDLKDLTEESRVAGANGVTLYNRYKQLLGTLIDEDMYGYRWMDKDFARAILTLTKEDEVFGAVTINEKKVKVKPVIVNNKPRFHVQINAAGSLTEVNNDYLGKIEAKQAVEKIKDMAEEQIKKEVMRTYRQALQLDADIYRLSEVLYRKDLSSWKQYEENGGIPLDEQSINLDVKVRIQNAWKGGLRRSVK